jgi:hypothetical protein
VKEVSVNNAGELAVTGGLRFDSKLTRNIIFVINLVRTLRLHLSNELHYGSGQVVSAHANTAQRLTEMFGNEVARARK